MKIMDYINEDFNVLRLEDSIAEVKETFKDLPFTHFPIIDDGKLIGMLAQADIIHLTKNESLLSEMQYFFRFYKTDIPDSCIDLIRLFAQHDTDILPITDKNNVYLGYFELDEILRLFYKSPFFKQNSTTLLIEKDSENYSMSEIVQIVESNNITLLGLYISNITNNHTQVTLILDTEDVNEVIQSFRRYNYKVLTHNKNDLLIEQFKSRADYLHKYLNI